MFISNQSETHNPNNTSHLNASDKRKNFQVSIRRKQIE